jgi:multicomponent Na+:H+ antiporter subunit E
MEWTLLVTALLWRTALFGLAWAAIAEGLAAPVLGAITALGSALASLALLPSRRGGVRGTLALGALLPLLFWEAVLSGVDVAYRAFRPTRPLDPGFLDLSTGHGSTHPVTLATAVVMNLMPGTLTMDFTRRGLHLHVIDRGHDHRALLSRIERRLAWVFGTGHG